MACRGLAAYSVSMALSPVYSATCSSGRLLIDWVISSKRLQLIPCSRSVELLVCHRNLLADLILLVFQFRRSYELCDVAFSKDD